MARNVSSSFPSWAVLGAFKAFFRPSWAISSPSLGPPGPSWGDLRGLLDHPGAWRAREAKLAT
eukprot:1296903-Pyramimonas_sp.AAC.1